MTILKLTSSGKGVQIIDDSGNVYMSSVTYLKSLLAGTSKHPVVFFSRLPFKVSPDKFGVSKLYDPDGLSGDKEVQVAIGSDPMGKKTKKILEDINNYSDEVVW